MCKKSFYGTHTYTHTHTYIYLWILNTHIRIYTRKWFGGLTTKCTYVPVKKVIFKTISVTSKGFISNHR